MKPFDALAVGIAIVLLGTAAIVRAQDGPSATVEPTAEDRRLSALLLDRSAVAYRLGRYEEAVVMLEDAYVLSQEPILLYNLGRAYEGAGDTQHALHAYRRYLETSAEIPNADAVRATIAALELQREADARAAEEAAERARVEAIRREADAQRSERAARAERLAQAERAREERDRREREARAPWPWVIAGTGVATVVAGAVVGAVALDREGDAARAEEQTVAASTLGEARDLAMGANVSFAVGGVLALAGVTWGIVELAGTDASDERVGEVSVELAPTPGGVTVRGRF